MKAVVFGVLVLLFSLVFTTGCGKSNAMLSNHMDKVQKRNQQKYGSVHSTSPDFISLVQKAPTQRSRYILELISKFDKNPDSIPTKISDPSKDKRAKLRADKIWREEKKRIKTLGKINGWGSTTLRILKETKKEIYKPTPLVLETPPYIDEIAIQNPYKRHMPNGTTLNIESLIVVFPVEKDKTVIETQQSIIKEFDTVLTKNGWGKTAKVDESNQKDALENYKELVAFYKQKLKETSTSNIQERKYIKKKIQEMQNLVKSTQKKLKKVHGEKAHIKNTTSYVYQYRSSLNRFLANNFTIAIITGNTNVLMRISKTRHSK